MTASTTASKPDARRRIPMLDTLVNAVIQPRTLQRVYPGVMHFLIFWGMTIQVIGTVINILQYPLFLPFDMSSRFPLGTAYQWFELVMDIAGGMILFGAGSGTDTPR